MLRLIKNFSTERPDVADGVGFQPTEACRLAGFQDRCLKPLGHPRLFLQGASSVYRQTFSSSKTMEMQDFARRSSGWFFPFVNLRYPVLGQPYRHTKSAVLRDFGDAQAAFDHGTLCGASG